MKNIIISILATIIFYTQFCVIKMWYVMPVFALCVWIAISEIDCVIEDYQKTIRQGRKLQRKIKRLGGVR